MTRFKAPLTGLVSALAFAVAAPASAGDVCDINGVVGVPPADLGSLECGTDAVAIGAFATAVGYDAAALSQALAVGARANAEGFRATALGFGASAVADYATAIGAAAAALDVDGVAIGAGANAQAAPLFVYFINRPADGAVAPLAIGTFSTAFGYDSMAVGNYAIVGIGGMDDAFVAGTAVGANSRVSANSGTALGAQTLVTGAGGTALGAYAEATGFHATAIGSEAAASASNATAIGMASAASATNSVAIGYRSVANQSNTVSIGDVGTERRIVNVAAGTAGTDAVNVAQLNSAISNGLSGIQSDIDELSDLRGEDRRDMKQGVAVAIAISNAPMPSEPGRISYAVNGATFRGEYAVGGSMMYRLKTTSPMAINVGISHAGDKNTGVRVGVAGEF